MIRTLVCFAAFVGFASQVFAGIFDVGGKPAQSVTAFLPGHEPQGEREKPWEMWLRHSLESGELTKLRASSNSIKRVELTESARLSYVLLCERETDLSWVDVFRDDEGRFYARVRVETSDEKAEKSEAKQADVNKKSRDKKVVELDRDKVAGLTYPWPKCIAQIAKPAAAPPQSAAKIIQLDALRPGWFAVDQGSLEDRFVHGRDTQNPGSIRVLKDAHAVLRLPKDYDPSLASGLLVFIHAAPQAIIPDSVGAICDELNFLCVAAADVGNETPIADRLQRSLDAVATVEEQYLVDQSRVYATGVSGGGKLSVHAWLGYSEVFRGAVPCVGMSAYENLKRADGKYYRGDFPKPGRAAIASLRDHRLAAITGDKDFNYEHIKLSIGLYQRDKFDVKLIDIPGMRHEFAAESPFSDALRWVDEPWRNAKAEAASTALKVLERCKDDHANVSERERQEVLHASPFTREGWRALEVFSSPR